MDKLLGLIFLRHGHIMMEYIMMAGITEFCYILNTKKVDSSLAKSQALVKLRTTVKLKASLLLDVSLNICPFTFIIEALHPVATVGWCFCS